MTEIRGNSRFWHDVAVRSVKLLNIILICLPVAYIWLTYYSDQVYGGSFGLVGTYETLLASEPNASWEEEDD